MSPLGHDRGLNVPTRNALSRSNFLTICEQMRFLVGTLCLPKPSFPLYRSAFCTLVDRFEIDTRLTPICVDAVSLGPEKKPASFASVCGTRPSFSSCA